MFFYTFYSPSFCITFLCCLYYILSLTHIKNSTTLSKSINLTAPAAAIAANKEFDSSVSQDADEGFASSSSVEQDQIFEVIRRKKRASYQPQQPSQQQQQQQGESRMMDDFKLIDASRKIIEESISMAPLESILWTVSFFWVFFQLYQGGHSLLNNHVMAGKGKKKGSEERRNES